MEALNHLVIIVIIMWKPTPFQSAKVATLVDMYNSTLLLFGAVVIAIPSKKLQAM